MKEKYIDTAYFNTKLWNQFNEKLLKVESELGIQRSRIETVPIQTGMSPDTIGWRIWYVNDGKSIKKFRMLHTEIKKIYGTIKGNPYARRWR